MDVGNHAEDAPREAAHLLVYDRPLPPAWAQINFLFSPAHSFHSEHGTGRFPNVGCRWYHRQHCYPWESWDIGFYLEPEHQAVMLNVYYMFKRNASQMSAICLKGMLHKCLLHV